MGAGSARPKGAEADVRYGRVGIGADGYRASMDDSNEVDASRSGLGRWLRATVGTVCIVLGLTLLGRPLTTATVIVLAIAAGFVVAGVSDLIEARTSDRRAVDTVVAVAWVVAGVVLVASPRITLAVLLLLVGIGLMVRGVLRVLSALRESADQRGMSGILGVATVLFGVLALALPDVSFFVVAVGFGGWLVLHGLSELWAASLGHRDGRARTRETGTGRRGVLGRWVRVVGAVVSLAVAVGLSALALSLRDAVAAVDAFYTPPASVSGAVGALLRTEPFTREVPGGALAWRILYTTTRDDGQRAVASALVVTPEDPAVRTGAAIVWTHGTTGYARHCAPSLQRQPFESGALFSLDRILEQGWTLVATDYIGLGTQGPHTYLIGQGEAHAALDAMRAARQLDALTLDGRSVVWGHSQGGGAALWAGVLAPSYAPEIDLLGVAALAPVSDLHGLLDTLPDVPGGAIFASYVLAAYSQTYPDVDWDRYVHPGASTFLTKASTRCLSDPALLLSVVESLAIDDDVPWYTADPGTGPFGQRLTQNTPPPGVEAPLLIGQGLVDPLIVPAMQERYVAGVCAAGHQVDYRTYEGRDHVGLVTADSPLIAELLAWTQDRLAGAEPAPSSICATSP